ncbi:MAG TPA: tetratricopeptide repeat protein, partial [Bacteroidetes bacterium]|nr:tetratricopeptide repeat protein [Bacteroidota bacterium]
MNKLYICCMMRGWTIGFTFILLALGTNVLQGQTAVRFYNEAVQFYLNDAADEAEEKVRLALKIQRSYPDAWFLLGQTYAQRGIFKTAIKYYKKALKQTPNNPDYRFHKALAYDEMGKLRKAIRFYLETTAVDPHYVLAWKRLGAIYFLASDYPRAIDNYSHALDSNPMDKDALLSRGNAQAALGHFPEAISDYDQALQLDSADPNIYYNRASAFFSNGDAYAAVKDFSMVLERRPEDRDAWLNRGISLLALELYPQALEDLDRALALDSNHADTWWNRAYLLHEQDSVAAARA